MQTYMLIKRLSVAGLTMVLIWLGSCSKNSLLTSGGEVSFSVDTLMFDTVFTAQGSATRSVKIFNKQNQKIKLSSIGLRKGANSAYRLNVNGTAGTEIDDVEIAANDSVWVFAAVTIDPTDENNPFVEDDDLVATLNGQEFSLPFIAFGQNAHYIVDSTLSTQTWLTDKPYVIVRNALVDEGQTLTIPAGVRVYVHQDSRLYVLGTLKIEGTKEDSVIFQGDRLDPLVWIGDYIDIPGQWGGLYFFQQSHDNEINYAVFKNGGAATVFPNEEQATVLGATIQIDPDTILNGTPKLKMTNSVIYSSQGYGILGFNSSLTAENCRITECGGENVMFFEGGNYKLYDCTIGTYGGEYLSHTENLSLAILNYYPTSQTTYTSNDLTAEITNCIIYGSLENEVYIDKKEDNSATVILSYCLLKSTEGIGSFVTQLNNIFNQDPQYVDYGKNDYHLQSTSPAIGMGIAAGTLTTDFDGVSRPASPATAPAIGCYEYKP
ncbi:MAG: right-handed parallel beta-helix repeat-containing protein [Edaphocola sp.]